MQKLRPVPDPKPHRHTLTEAYAHLLELLHSLLNKTSSERESVMIGRNSRGYYFEVKGASGPDDTIDDVELRVRTSVERLAITYPPENHGA